MRITAPLPLGYRHHVVTMGQSPDGEASGWDNATGSAANALRVFSFCQWMQVALWMPSFTAPPDGFWWPSRKRMQFFWVARDVERFRPWSVCYVADTDAAYEAITRLRQQT